MTARLVLTSITKRYPSVVANQDIDLAVMPGEIHAVLGENGAGKSTLMKVIYGAVKPDDGTIRWEGRDVVIANPARARRLGIGMVFQHFSLFETLTVADNIALALEGDARAPDSRIESATSRRSTACPSIPRATCTRCRSASGNASRSCGACCRARAC